MSRRVDSNHNQVQDLVQANVIAHVASNHGQSVLPPSVKRLNSDLLGGMFAGVVSAGLLNPLDRALYLSVKNHEPFFRWANFKAPYQGFSQTVVQRAFQGGVYFAFQGELTDDLYPYVHGKLHYSEPVSQFAVGTIAGSMSALLMNPFSAVKYHNWGHPHHSFVTSVHEMWRQGGMRPFFKGTAATVKRDLVFGGVYELVRFHHSSAEQQKMDFMMNMIAGALAASLSSPLNYARNVQYATPPTQPSPSTHAAISQLYRDSLQYPIVGKRLAFFQHRLQLGAGTARVGVGMAIGQQVADAVRSYMAPE